MIVEEYRGSGKGLQALSRMELLAMLKRYRAKHGKPIKHERESDDEVTVLGCRSRKRRCGLGDEAIGLD